MKNYYQILELQEGASPSEIKKAYFKLIRQYTPESDPERFMAIREAYDNLKDGNANDQFIIPIPDLPLAHHLIESILAYDQADQYKKALTLCQEALQHFPNALGFRYLLGCYQLKSGNTGNAIKTFEILTNEEPENRHYQLKLADAYMMRGFTKKALPVFKKAYALGCRSNEFFLTFATACQINGDPETGRQLILTLVQSEQKKTQAVMDDLSNAFILLYALNASCMDNQQAVITDCLCEFFQNSSSFLESNLDMVLTLIVTAVEQLPDHNLPSPITEMITLLQNTVHEEENKKELVFMQELVEATCLPYDDRFSLGINLITECIIAQDEDEDDILQKFIETDAKLCMLEEWPAILPEFVILETDYPLAFQMFAEFIQTLRENKNLTYLKEKLLDDYARMEKFFNGGQYYEKYPPKNYQRIDPVFGFSPPKKPFVKDTPKIGRNEPCPCGSGKKYKHCCDK